MADLKRLELFLDLLKNPTTFLRFWYFLGFLIFFYRTTVGSRSMLDSRPWGDADAPGLDRLS
jgi:hypothetical protein